MKSEIVSIVQQTNGEYYARSYDSMRDYKEMHRMGEELGERFVRTFSGVDLEFFQKAHIYANGLDPDEIIQGEDISIDDILAVEVE